MQSGARALFLVLLLAIGATVSGCLKDDPADIDPDPEAPQRVPTEAWRGNLTEPVYETIVSSLHYLDARDGTRLSLTLHLPDGLPADAKVPTLLELTPYQPLDQAFQRAADPGRDVPEPSSSFSDLVRRGAAVVTADARGTGGSSGCLDFGGTADREDARTFVDWIRSQDWSDGVVVTDGVSHPGMGSVVAHAAVPGLTAALTHAPVVSYYQDEWLQGARFENQMNGAGYQGIELVPPSYTDPDGVSAQAAPCTGETLLDFNAPDGRFAPVWQDRHLARHNDAGREDRTPILLTHGFVDLNVHPDHTQLYWDSLDVDHPKWLIMGWWYHGWPDMEGHPAGDFEDIRHRWLDATLFGHDNGLFAEPKVLVEDSLGTWHESDTWPLAPGEEVVLRPTQNGAMFVDQLDAPVEGQVEYPDRLDAYRGTWLDSHVAFRTEPLAAPMLVNGAPTVELVATSDTDSTKWVVYLMDEAPDGSWQRITHGYVDSHQWDGEEQWKAMVPGERYDWTVHLMPTAVVVEEGHRITLVVTSQDSEMRTDPQEGAYCFDDHRGGCYSPSGILPAETAGRATNTVFVGGENGTRVHLDWVDPSLTGKPSL